MRGATNGTQNMDGIFAISTHTPHAGRDSDRPCSFLQLGHFNSHAPCGARRAKPLVEIIGASISTHTPHAGRDIETRIT